MRLQMQDPYLYGVVVDDAGNELDIVDFDWYSEDESEWEQALDDALYRRGYERVGHWNHEGGGLRSR